jgi:hypothetical protein
MARQNQGEEGKIMRFKSKKSIALAIGLCIFLIMTIVVGSCTTGGGEEEEEEQQEGEYYLSSNLEDVTATIVTDAGKQTATFSGAIGFRVVTGSKGELIMSLDCLNLVAEGVPAKMGDSGVIGLTLAEPEYKTTYDPSTGNITAEFHSTLHYQLIDRIQGYQQSKQEGEQDLFASYTEEMVGNLTGQLPEDLQPADSGSIDIECDIDLDLSRTVIGSILHIRDLLLAGRIPWGLRVEAIKIQPVFIGTGPTDPARTGRAFDELMTRAREVWDKCGTVRCLKFVVNEPIYLDKPQYKVLDDPLELTALSQEVTVDDAVEIFVLERWHTALSCDFGDGSTYSSGTASACIVTSDQPLSVPCPCPCSGPYPCGTAACGAVNYYHLAKQLGHVLNLYEIGDTFHYSTTWGTAGSIMAQGSGFCCDDPNVQSAKNCRNAASPLLFWGLWTSAACAGSPDIMD